MKQWSVRSSIQPVIFLIDLSGRNIVFIWILPNIFREHKSIFQFNQRKVDALLALLEILVVDDCWKSCLIKVCLSCSNPVTLLLCRLTSSVNNRFCSCNLSILRNNSCCDVDVIVDKDSVAQMLRWSLGELLIKSLSLVFESRNVATSRLVWSYI